MKLILVEIESGKLSGSGCKSKKIKKRVGGCQSATSIKVHRQMLTPVLKHSGKKRAFSSLVRCVQYLSMPVEAGGNVKFDVYTSENMHLTMGNQDSTIVGQIGA